MFKISKKRKIKGIRGECVKMGRKKVILDP
jgi:hypothetical protein